MKKKMFAALALSATLAMGAVPAFADEPTTPKGSSDTPTDATVANGGDTSTTVKVQTVVDNITVAVPLNMTIVAKAAGGAADCPSVDTYLIQNKSVFPIKITAAKAEAQGTAGDWVLKTGTLDATKVAEGNVGDLALKLTTNDADAKSWDVAGTYTAGDFKVKAATESAGTTTPGDLKFKVEASSTKLKKTYDDATDAVKLTYTVAPDSVASTTPSA